MIYITENEYRKGVKMKKTMFLSVFLAWVMIYADVQANDVIQVCAAENDTNAIARLVTDGININSTEKSRDCSALHWAAYFNRLEAVRFLIERGADVNARNNIGMTPLHYAALCGHKDMVETLLEQKADVNALDCQGLTPLHLAAQYGHAEIVEILLGYGADIAAKTNYRGLTPLHWAAFWGHTEAINTLLKNGADINARDHNGYTPLTWAEQYNNYDMARLLARKGGKRHQHDFKYGQ